MTEISTEELMHLFRYCFNLMRRYHQTVHDKVGTRHGQGKILSILRQEDGIGQKDLAEKLRIRPASLSELLDKMQKSGWIQRQVNEADRRKINIRLTKEGEKVSQQMVKARREMADQMFGVLTQQEQGELERILQKLVNGLESCCEEDPAGQAHAPR